MKKLFTHLKQMTCSERKLAGTAGGMVVNAITGRCQLKEAYKAGRNI